MRLDLEVLGDRLRGLGGTRLVLVSDHEAGAGFRQAAPDREPEASCTAGDDGALAFERDEVSDAALSKRLWVEGHERS